MGWDARWLTRNAVPPAGGCGLAMAAGMQGKLRHEEWARILSELREMPEPADNDLIYGRTLVPAAEEDEDEHSGDDIE